MIQIKEIVDPNDPALQECVDIMWRTQGINVSSLEGFQFSAQSENALVLVVYDDEKVVGAAIAKIHDKGFEFYLPFGEEIVEKMKRSKVGSLSIMGFDEAYQNKGIGQQLSRRRLEWLESRKCDLIVGISWVSGLPHTSNRVFEKVGFKSYGEKKDFFEEMSIQMNLICPVCGNPPCKCPAILYVKEISY